MKKRNPFTKEQIEKGRRRVQALALQRRIWKLKLVRGWNVHADEDGRIVQVTDCVKSLNRLQKALGTRYKIRYGWMSMTATWNGPTRERWGTILIPVRRKK